MKIIKAKESELAKQAAIELLENWKPYLFQDNIRQWKRICNAKIATVLEV
jgi:hypothetical protein